MTPTCIQRIQFDLRNLACLRGDDTHLVELFDKDFSNLFCKSEGYWINSSQNQMFRHQVYDLTLLFFLDVL